MDAFMKVRDILKRDVLKSILLTKLNELKTAITNALGDVSGGLINDLKSDIPSLQNVVTTALDGFATDTASLIRGEIVTGSAQTYPNSGDYQTFSTQGVWTKVLDISPSECLKYNSLSYQITPQVETTLGTVNNYIKIGTGDIALTGGANVIGSMPDYLESINKEGAYQPSVSIPTGFIRGQCGRGNDYFLEPGSTFYIPKKISNTIDISSYVDIGKGLRVWGWLDTAGTGTPILDMMLMRSGS